MKEINAEFGSWFAGFTESQGLFSIEARNDDDVCISYYCPFRICQDLDNTTVLEMICGTLEIGSVELVVCPATPTLKAKEMSMFQIIDIDECSELVALLEKYPLRFRKRRQFEIWRDAAAEMRKPETTRDPDILAVCSAKLQEPVEVETPPVHTSPKVTAVELRLDFDNGEQEKYFF